jgi:signal transduction histidine kinase
LVIAIPIVQNISFSALDMLNVALRVDAPRIDQIVRNLVTNSVKYTPAGGSVTIRTVILSPRYRIPVSKYFQSEKSKQLHSTAVIVGTDDIKTIVGKLRNEIIDTGVGIKKENQHLVVREFTQFDRNKLQGGNGSGLGLWISRKIVEFHNGRLEFTSDGEGTGTTFYLELPLHKLPDDLVLVNNEYIP